MHLVCYNQNSYKWYWGWSDNIRLFCAANGHILSAVCAQTWPEPGQLTQLMRLCNYHIMSEKGENQICGRLLLQKQSMFCVEIYFVQSYFMNGNSTVGNCASHSTSKVRERRSMCIDLKRGTETSVSLRWVSTQQETESSYAACAAQIILTSFEKQTNPLRDNLNVRHMDPSVGIIHVKRSDSLTTRVKFGSGPHLSVCFFFSDLTVVGTWALCQAEQYYRPTELQKNP